MSSHIIFLIDIRHINEESSINNVLEKLCQSKRIVRIYGVLYNPKHHRTVEVFNRTVKNY